MRLRQLRSHTDVPDLADHVIHFTGRNGKRLVVDAEIAKLDAQQRLLHIVVDQRIRAFQTFGSGAPVVCMTESTRSAVTTLIRARRYEPCGIGFSKQFVFERNGGPALYIRGDEWPTVDALPQPMRSRAVRYWPGADADDGEIIPDYLANPSDWLQEREWRVPGDLTFGWDNVKFLIVPHYAWQTFYAEWIADWADDVYAQWFSGIPAVAMGQDGKIIEGQLGIWTD